MKSSSRIRNALALGRLLPVYAVLGLLKHLMPLRWLARWCWCAQEGPRDRLAEHRLTGRALRLSTLMRVSDRDCLQRSLLLYRILSRAGADPTLVVGFQQLDGKILGHAWVLVEGRPVIESEADLTRFSPTLRFGARGVLLPPEADLHATVLQT